MMHLAPTIAASVPSWIPARIHHFVALFFCRAARVDCALGDHPSALRAAYPSAPSGQRTVMRIRSTMTVTPRRAIMASVDNCELGVHEAGKHLHGEAVPRA